MNIGFSHGILSDSYEEQAKQQGYTFGDKADFVQQIGFGLFAAYIYDCITDGELDRILRKFQDKVLVKFIEKLPDKEDRDDRG